MAKSMLTITQFIRSEAIATAAVSLLALVSAWAWANDIAANNKLSQQNQVIAQLAEAAEDELLMCRSPSSRNPSPVNLNPIKPLVVALTE